MRIEVQHNMKEAFDKFLGGIQKQARYATAVALTRTAQDVKAEIVNEMRKVFDRPTSYTLRSLFLERATKENLTARVWIKDDYGSGSSNSTYSAWYLRPQIYGGSRLHKRFEKGLQAFGLMPAGMFAAPATGAKLDQYGNVSRGQIIQILSQLKVQMLAGSSRVATGSRRSNRTIARQGVTYFAVTQKHGGLVPGIWMRKQFAHGSAVKPVFIFVSKTNYKQRLFFFDIGKRVIAQRFPAHFKREFAAAKATAR